MTTIEENLNSMLPSPIKNYVSNIYGSYKNINNKDKDKFT